jgi:hypothetical protein
MKRRSPPPPDGEQSHFLLGSIVRDGFSSQGGADLVPIAPAVVRRGIQRRPSLVRLTLGIGLLGSAATAVIAAGASGWFSGPTVKFVVERAPGAAERKLRFTDGSTITAAANSRLRVLSGNPRGAHVRLEEGGAQVHIASRPRADWILEVGPYTLALAGADVEMSWSAAQTNLSVVVLSGAATVRGPIDRRDGLRMKAGEALVARASDGSWRVGRGRHQGEPGRELQAREQGLALGAAPAGLPSRLGPGPGEPATSALVLDGRCGGRHDVILAQREQNSAEPWTWVDRSGCLAYGQDRSGNHVPDFSHAGYRGGGVPLPFIPRSPGMAPMAPSRSGDDTAAVQAALDAMAERPADSSGFRGVVELGSGTFTVRDSLRLMASGVVLRGQGAEGARATVLRAVGVARPVIVVGSDEQRTLTGPSHRIVDAYVPVGARTFELESTEGLHVDDEIVVQRPFSTAWLALLGMDRVTPRRADGGAVTWRPGSGLHFERRITAIEGSRITVDVPLTNALEREFTDASVSKYTFPRRLSRVGIERLASKAEFDPDSDLGDGMFVEMNGLQNGWIREVQTDSYESGLVSLEENSKWVTVSDVVYTAAANAPGWTRGFVLGGQQNLILRARSIGAHHALATLSRSAGPNVVLDFTAVGRSPVLTPNRWTSGLLLDNVRIVDPMGEPTGEISMSRRGNGRGGGWSAANCVLWNSEAARLAIDSPPTAQNWIVGAAGEVFGSGNVDGSHAPRPESLYRAQLAERLGEPAISALSR